MGKFLKRETLSLMNNSRLEEGRIYELSGRKTEEVFEITIKDGNNILIEESIYFPYDLNEDHRSFNFVKTKFIYGKSDSINIYRNRKGKNIIAKMLVIS